MQAHITNYRGIASAALILDGITLIGGNNGAGKSSTAQAIGAGLTGEAVPVAGVIKSTAGQLVRSGTAKGSVKVFDDLGATEISWPTATVKTLGTPPASSLFAAGLKSVFDLPQKERLQIFTQYLHSEPTRKDLDDKLAPMNLGAKTVDRLWELIQAQGWDGAYSQIKEKGAKLKGQWELVTNDNYGAKKAESWIPENYEPGLEGASEANLQAIVTDARDNLEASIATEAVDDSRRADLEALAATVDARAEELAAAKTAMVDTSILENLERALDFANTTYSTAVNEYNEAMAELSRLKGTLGTSPGHVCPACKTPLKIVDHTIVKAETAPVVDETAIACQREELASLEYNRDQKLKTRDKIQKDRNEEYDRISERKTAAMQAVGEATQKLNDALNARDKLQEMGEAAEQQAPAADTDAARNALAMAERRLLAFQTKRDADQLCAAIKQNQELLKHIAPEGIRGEVLAKALQGVNEQLAKICTAAASWGPVSLASDFTGQYWGTPYHLLSESEQYRVRVALQLVMAQMDKSKCLVIDRADILDKTGRNGLIKAVRSTGIPAVICMTLNGREDLPDLAKAKIGRSYWIGDDGVVA